MPGKRNYPQPRKRLQRGTAWEIYWHWNFRRYSVFPGLQGRAAAEAAESVLRLIASCLASPSPVFPDAYASAPGARHYMEDRFGAQEPVSFSPGDWLRDYGPHIMREVKPSWAKPSLSMLGKLAKATPGGLEAVTPDQAQGFLDGLLSKVTPARRNRALIMCNRFYKWAVRTRRATDNPFDGIKLLKEVRASDIAYCTREERDRVIGLAKAAGQADWLAVPLALYAGLRRGEAYRVDWRDVNLATRRLAVPTSKTKRPRRVPINSALLAMLLEVPETGRRGLVAPAPDGCGSAVDRATTLAKTIRRLAGAEPNPVPARLIGWNVFRHTFGSLLAQAGVSLDKICAWMGNTPEVCRRHYAEFVPRDARDEEIDRL
jgi:integrase/recombinase XerC